MQVIQPSKPFLPTGPPGCSCRQQSCSSSSPSPNPHLYTSAGGFGHLASVVHGRCSCAGGRMCCDSGGREMSSPRQTTTHVFQEEDKIGKGGSCDVYCGVEKGTGKRVALKVLRESSPAQQSQLLQEAETLGKLSSPKIVRLFGQNFELETGRPVVVLEYCSGGSLHSFLQQPENAHGLDDDDFRTLLSDLVEVLSYLRSKAIVHRDIKPANILRYVHDNGKCEYKLTDFGTSREAADTEQLTSIVGTEEYLHPILYKGAFFGKHTHSAINPTSGELWSLGCTLYHAMTGSVPFRPLGGARQNRKAMLVMISQKPPGTISGDQRLDGTFRWATTPPSNCRMSESLREKMTPLLQNLLETNSSRQWNFATFLDESQRILGMRCFHVCDTECGHLLRLYLEPRQSLAELQDALAYHTELAAGQQLLFHRVQPLLTLLGPRALVRDLPLTQWDQPLLLLSPRGATEGRCRRQVCVQPQLLVTDATLEEDVTSSFIACSDIYTYCWMALTFCRLPNLLFSAILALRNTLTSSQSTLETRFRVLSATCQERQSRMSIISQMMETMHPHPSSASTSHPPLSPPSLPKLSEARALCDQLRDRLWQLKYRLDEFRRGAAEAMRCDTSLLDSLSRGDNTDALKHMYEEAKTLWKSMQERRQKVPLSQLQQDKHKGDRATFNRLCMESSKRMKVLYSQKAALLEQYAGQVRQLHERLEAAQDMDSQLQQLKEESEQFSTLLDQIWRAGLEDLRKIVEVSRSSSCVKTSSPLCSQLGELISEGLPTLEMFHLNSCEASKK